MFACFYSEVLIGSMSSLFSLVVCVVGLFVCLLMATVIALTFAFEMLSVVDGAL